MAGHDVGCGGGGATGKNEEDTEVKLGEFEIDAEEVSQKGEESEFEKGGGTDSKNAVMQFALSKRTTDAQKSNRDRHISKGFQCAIQGGRQFKPKKESGYGRNTGNNQRVHAQRFTHGTKTGHGDLVLAGLEDDHGQEIVEDHRRGECQHRGSDNGVFLRRIECGDRINQGWDTDISLISAECALSRSPDRPAGDREEESCEPCKHGHQKRTGHQTKENFPCSGARRLHMQDITENKTGKSDPKDQFIEVRHKIISQKPEPGK